MNEKIQEMKADILSAMAHPIRLKIIEKLRQGPCCVCRIIPYVGGEQSNVSHHLAILKRAGILSSEKKGLEVWYEVTDPVIFEILDLIKYPLIKELKRKNNLLNALVEND
ncbi:hypothetical protein A2Y85_08110 [candidate division WOR-3 bacterium RBG_13_43_14]|uniref:HTH arsR-type domain-containing protein n=1 Tax=candidate division WOR-3 bacterium RBG_13_43_14 TaxID=1802590 RepID=A0A1F4UDD6_UNCW3|nr:MAG: hypothetical protein A2Y85_08110 [candidate division WOR-3 bacterium RBG_13_43_14]